MDMDDNLGLVSKLGPVSKYFLYQIDTKAVAYSSHTVYFKI